jgi:hypothetical protein
VQPRAFTRERETQSLRNNATIITGMTTIKENRSNGAAAHGGAPSPALPDTHEEASAASPTKSDTAASTGNDGTKISDPATAAEACQAAPENLPIGNTTAESGRSSAHEENIARHRMHYYQAVEAGMSVADASAYANELASLAGHPQCKSSAVPPSTQGRAAPSDPGERTELVAAALSSTSTMPASGEGAGDRQTAVPNRANDERERDPDVHPGLPMQTPEPLEEPDSATDGSGEQHPQLNVSLANCQSARVDRLPNGRIPPGCTGNPRGRPKELPKSSELESILQSKITVTQGAKKRKVTKETAILEQWVNQAV